MEMLKEICRLIASKINNLLNIPVVKGSFLDTFRRIIYGTDEMSHVIHYILLQKPNINQRKIKYLLYLIQKESFEVYRKPTFKDPLIIVSGPPTSFSFLKDPLPSTTNYKKLSSWKEKNINFVIDFYENLTPTQLLILLNNDTPYNDLQYHCPINNRGEKSIDFHSWYTTELI